MGHHPIRPNGLGRVFISVWVILAIWVLAVPGVMAQVYHAPLGGKYGRQFPDVAKRGVFMVVQYPVVQLDGKRERIVPGTRIMDTKNRALRPASLTGKRYVVNYVRYKDGRLNTVWILTQKEIRERRKVENPSWWQRAKEKFADWTSLLDGLGVLL